MRLPERLNAAATTTLPIKPTAGRQRWFGVYDSALAADNGNDVFVVVFDQRPATFGASVSDLLDAARWIGRPIAAEGAWGFRCMTMPGMWSVPGTNVQELTAGVVAGRTWAQLLATGSPHLNPHGSVGLSSAPSGTWAPAVAAGTPALNVLSAAAEDFGVTWKLDRRGRFVWSTTETDVFPTSPVLALVDGTAPAAVGGVPAVSGEVVGFAASVAHYTYKVLGSYEIGLASEIGPRAGVTLGGSSWEPDRFLDLSSIDDPTTATDLTEAAVARYDPFDGPRVSFDFAINPSRRPVDVAPGDPVWVFAPDYRVGDSTLDPQDVAGERQYPARQFVTRVDAQTHEDSCVALFHASTDDWEDITDDVELGDGSAVLRLSSSVAEHTAADRSGIAAPTNVVSEILSPIPTGGLQPADRIPQPGRLTGGIFGPATVNL